MSYEIRGFVRAESRKHKTGWIPVRTARWVIADPHYAALELFRLKHGANSYNWRWEVRDLSRKRGKLAPIVTYEELLRRTGSLQLRDRSRGRRRR